MLTIEKHYLQQELYSLVQNDPSIFNFIEVASRDGLWYWNLEKPEDEWMNETFWHTLGYNPVEMPHSTTAWQKIIFKDDLDSITKKVNEHLEHKSNSFEQLVRYKHKNNSTVWIQCRGMAIYNEQGVPTRMLGAHINVTDIKEKEITISAVNSKLKSCIANLGDLVFVIDHHFRINEYYTENAYNDLYTTPENFVGKSLAELHFPPELTHQFINTINITLQNGTKQTLTYDLHIQQSLKHFQLTTIPVLKNVVNTEVICVIDNISAIKYAEKEKELLANLVHNATDAIITKGENNLITNWNKGAEALYGYTKEEALGKNLYHLTKCNIQKDELEKKLQKLINEGFWKAEMIHYHKNGTPLQVEISSTAMNTEGNAVNACISIIKDIKQQKKVAYQLQQDNYSLTLQVKDKTTEINDLLEKINDGFITINHQQEYTYINKKACNLIKKTPTDVLGKNIWEVFPEAVESATYFAIQKALATQQYVTHVDFFKPLNLWQENHIYPTENGLSIFIRDITESKLALEKTIVSERNLKAIFNSTSEGFVLIDAHTFQVKTFNQKAKEFAFWHGNNKLETGKHIYNFILPERVTTVQTLLYKVIAGETIAYDKDYLQADGTVKWLHYSIVPVFDNNKMYSICITGKDISERKNAEQKIADREMRFRKLIENSFDGFILLSATQEVLEISNRGLHILGIEEKEIIGNKNFSFLSSESIGLAEEMLQKIIENPNQNIQIECKINCKQKKWIEAGFHNQLNEPSIQAIVVNFRDITNRKKNEEEINKFNERFILISKATNDAVWDWNLITNEIWWSEAHYTLFGFNPAEPLPSQEEFMSKIHPEDVPKLFAGFERIYTEKIKGWDGETRFFKQDGTIGTAYQRCFVLYNTNNEPIRLLGSFMDITKAKNAEEKLRHSHELIVKLTNNLKGAIYQIKTYTNGNSNFEFISKGIEQLFPHVSLDEIKQQLLDFSYIEDEDKQRVIEGLKIASEQLSDWECEYRVNIEKELKWLRVISHPEQSTDGSITWYGNIEDVTERRKQLIAIETQNKQLREIAWMQSHIVRAPVARILGIVQHLYKDINWLNQFPYQREMLQHIVSSANELDIIIRKIVKHTESIDNLNNLDV